MARKKKSISRKVLIYFVVIAVLLGLLVFVNQLSNRTTSDNVYKIPISRLSPQTVDLLDNPNYQNIILPEALDERLANQESFFIYYFSSTCPYCMETTPKLNPIIAEAGVDVKQFNLDVYRDGFNKYNITYTPTLVFYENGAEKDRIEGGLVEGSNLNTEQTFIDFFKKYKEAAS